MSAFWKFTERILAQLISFIVSIILARVLSPEDYSLVGIVLIFFSFANILISGGLNTALIQKKNADAVDYFSVLVTSIVASVGMYVVLWFLSPVISQLYNKDELTLMLRVMGIVLPINAVKSVWCAHISSNLMFKKFFLSTIGGTILSALVGIWMAVCGFGAWALITQQIANILIGTIIIIITTKINLICKFSIVKLKRLFSYGWKVLVSSIIGSIYSEITPLIIGVKFTATDLSFYTKGKTFPGLISSTSINTLSAVLFPVLSNFQDDKNRLLSCTRRFISVSSYLAFPLMLGLYVVSENFVSVLLTEKWLPAVPYLKIFCVSAMFDVIHTGNCETIKAMGKSGVFLVMEIIKKTSYFIIIMTFVFWGKTPIQLAISSIVCALIATIVNSIPNKILIGYKYRNQICDLFPNLIIAILMTIGVNLAGKLISTKVLSLLIQILVGIILYIVLSVVTHNKNLCYILGVLKNYKKRNKE